MYGSDGVKQEFYTNFISHSTFFKHWRMSLLFFPSKHAWFYPLKERTHTQHKNKPNICITSNIGTLLSFFQKKPTLTAFNSTNIWQIKSSIIKSLQSFSWFVVLFFNTLNLLHCFVLSKEKPDLSISKCFSYNHFWFPLGKKGLGMEKLMLVLSLLYIDVPLQSYPLISWSLNPMISSQSSSSSNFLHNFTFIKYLHLKIFSPLGF